MTHPFGGSSAGFTLPGVVAPRRQWQNRCMRRFATCFGLLATALSLLVAVSLPATARADGGNSKVDQRLAAQVASSSPDTNLHVLVTGPGAGSAVTNHGGSRGRDLGLVSGVAATVKAGDVAALAADSDVSFVAPDPTVAPTGTIDPTKLATFYPKVDGAPAAWNRGLTGSGVGVAVIDSGIKYLNDFARLSQVSLPNSTLALDDTFGHGTIVAGVLGGQSGNGGYVGIAPGTSLYSVNVNRPDGVRTSDVIAGLQWVLDNAHAYNIRVVNLSLQETMPGSYQMSLLDLAVERVWASGVVVVVAAGNNGTLGEDFAPANDPLALTVGATDSNDTLTTVDDTVASFSSSGVTVDGFAKPDMLAPGRHIAAPVGKDSTLWSQAPLLNQVASGYVSISGTSFAAPQVAGAAALLLQQHPAWSPDNVKWLLTSSARPVGASNTGALAVDQAVAFAGTPALANQGVPALVCAPGTTCVVGGVLGTVSSSWNSASWNSASWNSASWNSASWNSASWNSASWNSASWNSASWNSSSWNSASWNSASWNSASWNSASWNSASWNSVSWN
jgi:serine protease AprX